MYFHFALTPDPQRRESLQLLKDLLCMMHFGYMSATCGRYTPSPRVENPLCIPPLLHAERHVSSAQKHGHKLETRARRQRQLQQLLKEMSPSPAHSWLLTRQSTYTKWFRLERGSLIYSQPHEAQANMTSLFMV